MDTSRGSNTDSTFLLLSSTPISSTSNPIHSIPRPRSLPILLLADLIDLLWSIKTIIISSQSVEQIFGVRALYIWGILRPLLVLYVISNRRVREKGWLLLAQVIITILVCLYHVNEFQQRRPDSSTNPTLSNSFPYLSTSLAFSFLHYFLYAIFIGIRRPFVLNSSREQYWEGESEEVGNESIQRSTSLYEGEGSDEDNLEESSDEEDEIIDIPKPQELRNRTSRATLREGISREESSTRGSRIVSTNYGSFTGI